jgi:transcription elongation factor Elf1
METLIWIIIICLFVLGPLHKPKRGKLNEALICPHCGQKGHVRIEVVKAKKGISGAKATGAILTSGLSILITGLSRKETVTKAHCENCNVVWQL